MKDNAAEQTVREALVRTYGTCSAGWPYTSFLARCQLHGARRSSPAQRCEVRCCGTAALNTASRLPGPA